MTGMKNAVVVLGGSFNPPTIAHAKLISCALDATGAPTGVLIPSSHAYVSRKCSRTGGRLVFTEQERLGMLSETAAADPRVEIRTFEFGDDGRGHTYRTMQLAQKTYPGRRCLFLLGADKLRIVPRWHDAEKFLSEFGIVATSRSGSDAERLIRARPMLSAHAGNITVIPTPEGLESVSSSLFQEKLLAGDPSAAELVTPYVYGLASEIAKTRKPKEKRK